ncbi:MAG: hypothetical protein H8E55_12240 [Pelagibacterales bacterium]|nr:hypothetical protein [Pelagibacterales bacterium]
MKKYIRNLTILVIPFLAMITVNEIVKPTIKEKPYSKYGITAINSADKMQINVLGYAIITQIIVKKITSNI